LFYTKSVTKLGDLTVPHNENEVVEKAGYETVGTHVPQHNLVPRHMYHTMRLLKRQDMKQLVHMYHSII
jgi:hypothetical protein